MENILNHKGYSEVIIQGMPYSYARVPEALISAANEVPNKDQYSFHLTNRPIGWVIEGYFFQDVEKNWKNFIDKFHKDNG